MKRPLLIALAVTCIVAAVSACTPNDVATYDCLSNGRAVYVVPDRHTTPWPAPSHEFANGSAIDARGDLWDNSVFMPNGFAMGIKFHEMPDTRNGLCMVGGTIRTSMEPENTPWLTWHKVYGMMVEIDNFTLVGTTFQNQGDMISFTGAQNWRVIGVSAEGPAGSPGAYMHDDCIENDTMETGLVQDSKFDGCNVFLSSNSSADGTGETVEVRGNLVRLQKYRNSFDTAKYGENQHGGFFKWSDATTAKPPKLIVKDSTFRADQRGVYGGNANGFLGLPPGTECDNVMLIGTAAWRATDLASWTSQCTNLTLGTTADWDAQVAAWDSSHPAP